MNTGSSPVMSIQYDAGMVELADTLGLGSSF
jgi:hypothetical protein